MKLGNSAVRKHRSNKGWLQEHVNDHYVKKANAEGWRSRAVFKLSEIDSRDKLFKPGMIVVDLGATPGSWSQYAAKRVQPGGGRVVALDVLEMDPIAGVDFIQGDFREDSVLAEMENRLGNCSADIVLSDMAPNISGIAVADQARAAHLAELALEFARGHLKPGGDLLMKLFQGSEFMELREAAKREFDVVCMRKPAASRDRSSEVFMLARHKRA